MWDEYKEKESGAELKQHKAKYKQSGNVYAKDDDDHKYSNTFWD